MDNTEVSALFQAINDALPTVSEIKTSKEAIDLTGIGATSSKLLSLLKNKGIFLLEIKTGFKNLTYASDVTLRGGAYKFIADEEGKRTKVKFIPKGMRKFDCMLDQSTGKYKNVPKLEAEVTATMSDGTVLEKIFLEWNAVAFADNKNILKDDFSGVYKAQVYDREIEKEDDDNLIIPSLKFVSLLGTTERVADVLAEMKESASTPVAETDEKF